MSNKILYNGIELNGSEIRVDGDDIYVDGEKLAAVTKNDRTKAVTTHGFWAHVKRLFDYQHIRSKLIVEHRLVLIGHDVRVSCKNTSLEVRGNATVESFDGGDIRCDNLNAVSLVAEDVNADAIKVERLQCSELSCDEITAQTLHVSGDLSCDDLRCNNIQVGDTLNADDVHCQGDVKSNGEINCGDIVCKSIEANEINCDQIVKNVMPSDGLNMIKS